MNGPLSEAEGRRYARQMALPEVGPEGQARLRGASVLLVGAGGLGSPLALYLAAAGVGRLGLVDPDRVEASNLHRQLLYGESDLGELKVEVAARRLREINPHVEVEAIAARFDEDNALALVRAFDVVADGTDNFATRYLVNDACVLAGRVNVFASVQRFEGQVTVFAPGRGPCYRCLFPAPPPAGMLPSCAEAGVLGVLPGLLGTLQASEVLKLLLGVGEPLIGRLLLVDALSGRFRDIKVPRRAECAVCSERATIRSPRSPRREYESCGPSPARAGEEGAPLPFEISVAELAEWRAEKRVFTLLDVRTPQEVAVAALPGARLVVLHELPGRLGELPTAEPIVVFCHLGGRSAQAVAYLRARGFPLTVNLAGGIDAWSAEIDPSVRRY